MTNKGIALNRNPRTAICVTNNGSLVTFVGDERSNQIYGLFFLNEMAELL